MKCECLDIFLFFLLAVHSNCDYVSKDFSEEKLMAFHEDYFFATADDDDNQSGEVANMAIEKVNIQVFYEVFCPHCRNFDTKQFKQVVKKLHPYLNIKTYPYGNAKTVEKDGKVEFICQHGPTECYGNKLHACALHHIKNETKALLYNICMMEYSNTDLGSDDEAAAQCAKAMSVDCTLIKLCAKGTKGTELLRYYGEESKKANFKHVPFVLINGVKSNLQNFTQDVCAAFTNPPEPCASQ